MYLPPCKSPDSKVTHTKSSRQTKLIFSSFIRFKSLLTAKQLMQYCKVFLWCQTAQVFLLLQFYILC